MKLPEPSSLHSSTLVNSLAADPKSKGAEIVEIDSARIVAEEPAQEKPAVEKPDREGPKAGGALQAATVFDEASLDETKLELDQAASPALGVSKLDRNRRLIGIGTVAIGLVACLGFFVFLGSEDSDGSSGENGEGSEVVAGSPDDSEAPDDTEAPSESAGLSPLLASEPLQVEGLAAPSTSSAPIDQFLSLIHI